MEEGRPGGPRSQSILRVVADTLVGLECRKNLKANMTGQRTLGMGVLFGGKITQCGFIKNGTQVNGSRQIWLQISLRVDNTIDKVPGADNSSKA